MRRKRRPKVIYWKRRQRGRTHPRIDRKRRAMKPGKRRSKSGRIYYEYRKNRSDLRNWI